MQARGLRSESASWSSLDDQSRTIARWKAIVEIQGASLLAMMLVQTPNQFPNCLLNPGGTPVTSVSCQGPLRPVDQLQPLFQW